eukprot:6955204-Pyramimonas_sp.AAC.1
MLTCCMLAARRRAPPPRGAPVELAWVMLDPAANPNDPEQLRKKVEEQRIRAAELREDVENLAEYSSPHMCKVGRAMLQRMGWRAGNAP